MTSPKRYGGSKRSPLDRYVVLEELLAAGAPVGGHWVAERQSGPLLMRYAGQALCDALVPRIVRGELSFCIGMSEPDSGSDLASIRTRAERVDGGWVINGSKLWTSGAHRTTDSCSAPNSLGPPAVPAGLPVAAATLRASRASTGSPQGRASACGPSGCFKPSRDRMQIAGVLERILNQTVQYANERIQFGKPIGKFQAIQQQLVVFANQTVAARMAAACACAALPGNDWARQVPIARIVCGQAASQAAGIAHQVHGAIGYTYEHSLHFSTRRLWSWRAEYGSDSAWAAVIGREAIARGGAALWEDLTVNG